ncbi:MAG TPA: folylpolyglutamate synthase/dihydrofolate synthase family protein [Terriglobia bacterium]|nr:folylpolyglutamate synthase/dihydrofolate synthase family protein [Terriglobia bacterium]
MNYADCLKHLASLGQELHGQKFGLEAISRVLTELGRPHERYDTVIVAGTNGKGSTCAMLASILQHAGYRTGLFTSPHLVRVNERMRVNGHEVSDEDFALAFTAVAIAVDRLVKLKDLEKPLSFFEFLTATAFQYFAQAGAKFVVLEVGMGGRLDATNVTDPRVALITNIDFDHTEFLGSTLAAIAAEKAGIIKPHRPVISGVEEAEAAAAIRGRAEECGAELLELKTLDQISKIHSQHGRYSFDLALGNERYAGLTCPLLGKFQVKNMAAAVAAAWRLEAEGFGISRRSIWQGLRTAVWPGRLEPIHKRPLVLLDGGHNPGAAREIAGFVREEFPGRRLRLVYGSMRDKAIREICSNLFPLAEEVYLTHPEHTRAAAPEEILAELQTRPSGLQIETEPVRALERAYSVSAPDDVVLVVGSLFLVGAIKRAQSERKLNLRKMPVGGDPSTEHSLGRARSHAGRRSRTASEA